MKPKNLKHPFPWEKRTVLIQDRVWYVPDFLDNYSFFQFPGWSSSELFANQNPIYVEYCSGNGAWIAQKAMEEPQINWVAIEMKFERVRKIWSKIKNLQLNNLLVICGEGYRVTSNYFPSSCIEKVFINFPDPWPKKRHAKNRIIKPAFMDEIGRILTDNGVITMVTDDPDYSHEMTDTVSSVQGFSSLHQDPCYVTHLEGYGSSYFDQLWRDKGKVIHYHQYRKRHGA